MRRDTNVNASSRIFANGSEYFRNGNPTSVQYKTSNALIAPPPPHSPPQFRVKVRFLTYISPGEDSIKSCSINLEMINKICTALELSAKEIHVLESLNKSHYGDLVYNLKKIVGSNNFSAQFIKTISHYKKIGYNINVLQQTACLVVNPITVGNFAFLFNCTPLGRTSDCLTVRLKDLWRGWFTVKPGLNPPVKYFTDCSKAVLLCESLCFFLSCVCYAFVRVCLYVPCGHLLGKG